MNENVKYGLDCYLQDVDPQYAVLLTGKWGCGKTFFVKEWLKEVEQRQEEYSIKPIYISLFGVSSMPALIEKVNKSLSPMMYNVEKYGKALLKFAGKVVLKYDSTIADMSEAKLAYEINPLDLLSIRGEEDGEISAQYKLFVFDDIERCQIAPEELMGFFDLCLEQLGCRLVVVRGSCDAQEEGWARVMTTYQEKIFSREYKIEPDIRSAASHFAEEVSDFHPCSSEYYKSHIDEIEALLRASKYSNLRSLRHALRSFSEIFEKLDSGADEYVYKLFIQYLAFSIEYHCGDKACLDAINLASFLYGARQKDSREKHLFDKYIPIQQKYRVKAFDADTYDLIKSSVNDGTNIIVDLNEKVRQIREKSLSERLRFIWNMENKEADVLIKEAKAYVLKPVENISEYLYVTHKLCSLEDSKVVVLRKSFEKDRFKAVSSWMTNEMQPSNMVVIQRELLRACAIQEREKRLPRFTWLYESLRTEISSLLENVHEPLIEMLEHVSNENMDQIAQMINDTDPYGHANYNMQSVFQKVNISKLCSSIRLLNNKNKNLFAEILNSRYNHDWDDEYFKRFMDEKESLVLMMEYIERCISNSTKMSRVAYSKIMNELEFVVNRLERILL